MQKIETELLRRELETLAGLRLAGKNMSQVARELGVSHSLVRNVVQNKSKSKKVKEYIENNSVAVKLMVIGG